MMGSVSDVQFYTYVAFVLFDGILTLLNLCILGLTLKLYTEWNKVNRLAAAPPRDHD